MLTLLKLVAGASIVMSVLNPSFSPRAEDCECKAKADGALNYKVPHAEDCECKAKA